MKPKFNMKGYPKGGGTAKAGRECGAVPSTTMKPKKVTKMPKLR